jgi:hypothetical protein
MKKKTYEEVIGTLRNTKPKLENSQGLTDQIISRLSKDQTGERAGITISDNCGKWNIFIGFRKVLAVAAAFLIGFFAFQQWEIVSKVSRLEEEVNNHRNNTISQGQLENLNASRIKNILEQQVKYSKSNLRKADGSKEPVIVDRSSLNRLIQLLEQAEEENRILKSEILKQFTDTIQKRPNINRNKIL